jgi:glycosyltransferase involved in cell wall biosynthesis
LAHFFSERASVNILQVNYQDMIGGASRSMERQLNGFSKAGHESKVLVGRKFGSDERIQELITAGPGNWGRRAVRRLETSDGAFRHRRGVERLTRGLKVGANLALYRDVKKGLEPYGCFPETANLDRYLPWADVLVCHNMHDDFVNLRGFFSLEELPRLSALIPTVLVLHSAWLLSGHCGQSLDCERWRDGCGSCPHPEVFPRILRDETATNWVRKADILSRCKISVVTPSHWLMGKVKSSHMTTSITRSRVIQGGVDGSVFHPADSNGLVRKRLGVADGAPLLLTAGPSPRGHSYRDFETLSQAAARYANDPKTGKQTVLVVLGQDGEETRRGSLRIVFHPYLARHEETADFYRAADVYMHSATADTFPNAILEAQACGTPVIATEVGGIPEQVQSFLDPHVLDPTGALSPIGDAEAMGSALRLILEDVELRGRLSENAVAFVRKRFSLEREVSDLIAFFQEAIAGH